jgi:pimeloyl-ACP methyl ester carboxylesterase
MGHMKLSYRSKRALLVFIIFYFLVGSLLTIFQERLIYQPNGIPFVDCPYYASTTRIVYNESRFFLSGIRERPLAVIYHGNAGSACDRTYLTDLVLAAGYDFLLVEYPGYGGDSQPPTAQAIRNTVATIHTYLDGHGAKPTVIIGESLGTNPALAHSVQAQPPAVILLTPFTSIKDIARHRFWFYPTDWLVTNVHDNRPLIGAYEGTTHAIVAVNDTLIPRHLSEALLAEARNPAPLVVIPQTDHNTLFGNPLTATTLTSLLKKIATTTTPH